jgi:hypothetical protein
MTLTSQAGRTHAIEASTDLNHWFTVTNFVMVGPSMQIILPNAENGVYGFYRVHRCPAVDLFEGNPARLTSP